MLDKVLNAIVGVARFVIFVVALMYWWNGNTDTATFFILVLMFYTLRDMNSKHSSMDAHSKD